MRSHDNAVPKPKARLVSLLKRNVLTPRQLAQKKYRATAKGKAACARAREKAKQKPGYVEANRTRVRQWSNENRAIRRVYERIWRRKHYQKTGRVPMRAENGRIIRWETQE